ncbi:hypothetical protein CYFUS_009595 [Cystobacter fuscus]|uniref:Immunity protein 50 n=1 Tax=Cystobacter fuscus TaxID=43 RepID=A0A250JJQ3_9BACT|nr:Imm50 family immunity protein [Cystobacter fuscus]ATB44114.1 hypothetical protein CYFUS_009595 [Cystobacter fuscus]
MAWMDLLGKAEFFRKLYPVEPSLRKVRVHEVELLQDGPTVFLRFDLNDFPSAPPSKWLNAGANTAHVKLLCSGVLGLEIQGWTTNNLADIDISRREEGGLILTASAEGFRFKGVFKFIWVDSISGYTQKV